DLSFANLSGTNLQNADLTAATMLGVTLMDVDLRGASTQSADFTLARMCGAQLDDPGIAAIKGRWIGSLRPRREELVPLPPLPLASLNSVTFSPDGILLASGDEVGTVRLWEVGSGKELRRFEYQRTAVWSVAFAPDGWLLASGGDEGTVRLWEVGSGKE